MSRMFLRAFGALSPLPYRGAESSPKEPTDQTVGEAWLRGGDQAEASDSLRSDRATLRGYFRRSLHVTLRRAERMKTFVVPPSGGWLRSSSLTA